MLCDFKGKNVIVTGGARGIGYGIAELFVQCGATVVLCDILSTDTAVSQLSKIKGRKGQVVGMKTDVTDRKQVQNAVDTVVKRFVRIDAVVANAALNKREQCIDQSWEDTFKVISVAQLGVYHTCQAAARQMATQSEKDGTRGKIVIIGSVMGEVVFPTNTAYNMSKAAVHHFGRTLSAELSHKHINVNVILPGWTDTPGERQHATEDQITARSKGIPWGRLGTTREVAAPVVFLCSTHANYISGALLRVDGGFTNGLDLREVAFSSPSPKL